MMPSRLQILAPWLTLALVAGFISSFPASSVAGWNFIIPGEAFSHLSIKPGAWVRYRIIDEAMHQKDTSFVYIAVPKQIWPGKSLFWLEMVGSSREAGGDDVLVKLLLSDAIKTLSPGDSIPSFIKRMYIREGESEVRKGEDEDFARLEENMRFDGSPWKSIGTEEIQCPAGTFACSKKERVEKKEKRISVGKSTLIKTTDDRGLIWYSGRVPIFEMVQYFLVRKAGTAMDPPIMGVPVSGLKVSSTQVELLEFGFGANSLLPNCN